MTAVATIYVGEPDIPAGLTISEYRRSRPRRIPSWRRILLGCKTRSSPHVDGHGRRTQGERGRRHP
jgi:hypothetical protein